MLADKSFKKSFKATNNMMMHKIGTELSLDLQWGHRVNMLSYFFRFIPSHSQCFESYTYITVRERNTHKGYTK